MKFKMHKQFPFYKVFNYSLQIYLLDSLIVYAVARNCFSAKVQIIQFLRFVVDRAEAIQGTAELLRLLGIHNITNYASQLKPWLNLQTVPASHEKMLKRKVSLSELIPRKILCESKLKLSLA